jgi:hypothetical protein
MRAVLASVILVGVVALGAATAGADPALGNVPPHHHYIRNPSGAMVEVGPRVCENSNLQRAFNQFHNNLHALTPTGQGPVAPGVHNGTGGELTFVSPC